ncbi:hypothetical protein [Nocardioides caldifontis]|uniref:hypothetical protein n=1 Tax=Nocardioides caldifontis TaxID=2588938 RepID=UPI0011DFA107|nr:hypothetical protein [Nocardioides caldifontis]
MDTSAEARVIASFTLIVALMLGAWSGLDHVLAGPSSLVPSTEIARLLVAATPFAATAVAFQAARAARAAWARTLGGAAVMLGVLTSIGGVLYFVANT